MHIHYVIYSFSNTFHVTNVFVWEIHIQYVICIIELVLVSVGIPGFHIYYVVL